MSQSSAPKKIIFPLDDEAIRGLRAGDPVLITGTMLTARDAAHKRLYALLEQGRELPVDLKGQVIYYVGPAPAKPGYAVGPAGPTSSYRMDAYTPALLDLGLKGMIGKGARSAPVVEAIVRNRGVYFAAIGGAAALIARSIVKEELLCYEDLGTEAIRRYTVKDDRLRFSRFLRRCSEKRAPEPQKRIAGLAPGIRPKGNRCGGGEKPFRYGHGGRSGESVSSYCGNGSVKSSLSPFQRKPHWEHLPLT